MSLPPSWRLCECGSKQDVERVGERWLCFSCQLEHAHAAPAVVVTHSRFTPADLDRAARTDARRSLTRRGS